MRRLRVAIRSGLAALVVLVPLWPAAAGSGVTPGQPVAWGENEDGQLGDGTNRRHEAPAQVVGFSAAGTPTGFDSHTLAVKADGTVWAWGNNEEGQLGDGTIVERTRPVPVAGLTNVRKVAAGLRFSRALKHDGTVWAWGGSSHTPVQVGGVLPPIADIAAGFAHTLAVGQDGSLWAWGFNQIGAIGVCCADSYATPVQVANAQGTPLSGMRQVAAGTNTSYARDASGRVWSWGANRVRQLGRDTTATCSIFGPCGTTPGQVANENGTGVLQDVAQVTPGGNWGMVRKTDGTVWFWGGNSGELGAPPAGPCGTDPSCNRLPTQVQGPGGQGAFSGVVDLVAGFQGRHALAITADRRVWAWGQGGNGQLGDGSTAGHNAPARSPAPSMRAPSARVPSIVWPRNSRSPGRPRLR